MDSLGTPSLAPWHVNKAPRAPQPSPQRGTPHLRPERLLSDPPIGQARQQHWLAGLVPLRIHAASPRDPTRGRRAPSGSSARRRWSDQHAAHRGRSQHRLGDSSMRRQGGGSTRQSDSQSVPYDTGGGANPQARAAPSHRPTAIQSLRENLPKTRQQAVRRPGAISC